MPLRCTTYRFIDGPCTIVDGDTRCEWYLVEENVLTSLQRRNGKHREILADDSWHTMPKPEDANNDDKPKPEKTTMNTIRVLQRIRWHWYVCANWKDFGNATTSLLKSILCCVSLLCFMWHLDCWPSTETYLQEFVAIHSSRTLRAFSNTLHWSQYALLSGPSSGSVWKPTHSFAVHHGVTPHADIAALILPTSRQPLNPSLSQTTTTSLLIHPNMPPPRPNAHYSSHRAQTNMMLEMFCKFICAHFRSVCLNENILFCIIFQTSIPTHSSRTGRSTPCVSQRVRVTGTNPLLMDFGDQTHRVVVTTDVGMSVLCQLATKTCKRLIPLKNMQRYIKNTKMNITSGPNRVSRNELWRTTNRKRCQRARPKHTCKFLWWSGTTERWRTLHVRKEMSLRQCWVTSSEHVENN